MLFLGNNIIDPSGLKGNDSMQEIKDCSSHAIVCDAKNCVYHAAGNNCTAKEIKVGFQSACESCDTACMTFRQKA